VTNYDTSHKESVTVYGAEKESISVLGLLGIKRV
jgi:hypothetical protein